jgi:hypothetical protein
MQLLGHTILDSKETRLRPLSLHNARTWQAPARWLPAHADRIPHPDRLLRRVIQASTFAR